MHAVKAYNFYMRKDGIIVLDLPKQNDESVSYNVVELVFL